MKFELKTENDNYLNSFSQFFRTLLIFAVVVIICDVSLKLGSISRNHQIHYNCRLLSVNKSSSNIKKLSKLSKLKSKQKIWEFCKEFVR